MSVHRNYLLDLASLLKTELEGSHEKIKTLSGEEKIFESGRGTALFQALDLMIQQANAFQISLEEIGLKNYNPYQYLGAS